MTVKTFEEALKELEAKLEALGTGRLPLAEALRTYEEGMVLLRICNERLAEAELRVSRLSASSTSVPE